MHYISFTKLVLLMVTTQNWEVIGTATDAAKTKHLATCTGQWLFYKLDLKYTWQRLHSFAELRKRLDRR